MTQQCLAIFSSIKEIACVSKVMSEKLVGLEIFFTLPHPDCATHKV